MAIVKDYAQESGAMALLNAVTCVTTVAKRDKGAPKGARQMKDHTVTLKYTETGTVTAMVVALEGSLDGDNWFEMDSKTLTSAQRTALGLMFHVANHPVHWVRAVVTATFATGVTTATVLHYSGHGEER